ncbi:MAG: hypothetical protein Rubg2KO_34830 [Rubricoccaceae bacterium]
MKTTILSLLALAILAGCSSIRSTIGIDPGEQFVLGGEQEGAFTAELLNVGPESVDIYEATADGDTLLITTLSPGRAARASFASGSAALLANPSRQEASIQAVVRGDTNLGMRYVPVD